MSEKLHTSIDPEKIIVQDGQDMGRIADKELAEIGARKTHLVLNHLVLNEVNPSDATKLELMDIAQGYGRIAMEDAVADRATELIPGTSYEMNIKSKTCL